MKKLVWVSLFVLTVFCAATSPAQIPTNSKGVSTVSASGEGFVKLQSTHLRASIPVSVTAATSADALSQLRDLKQQVLDRLPELGAIEESVQVVGVQCASARQQRVILNPAQLGPAPDEPLLAKCYVIADFKLPELQDDEARLTMGRDIIEELAGLNPDRPSYERRSSYSSLSSYLRGVDFEVPVVLFLAKVSDEHRRDAFAKAVKSAKSELKNALSAMEIDTDVPVSIQRQNYSSVLRQARSSHPVLTAMYKAESDYAISAFPDGASVHVQITATALIKAIPALEP